MKNKDDTNLQKKMIIFFSVAAVLLFVLIGLFVYSLDRENKKNNDESNDATKLFGLLSTEDHTKIDVITKEDREEEIAARPALTAEIEKRINSQVSKNLALGQFEELDKYLVEIENQYRDSDNANGITLNDIKFMRADLEMIRVMNPRSSTTMMSSFHNPEFLVAAMVYEPISIKYKGFINTASLVLTPPDVLNNAVWTEMELTPELKMSVMNQVNKNTHGSFNDIKIYSVDQFGTKFEYIIGHSISNDTWCAYLVQTQDQRAYNIISTAGDLMIQVRDGIMKEEDMDGSIIYFDINDMDIKTSDQQSGEFQNNSSARAMIDLSEEGIKKHGTVNIDEIDGTDYDPRELGSDNGLSMSNPNEENSSLNP